MSVNLVQGPLIEGDFLSSDGVVNGDLDVYGHIIATSFKGTSVKVVGTSQLTAAVSAVTVAVAPEQLLTGLVAGKFSSAGSGFILPTATAFVAKLSDPVVGEVYSVDFLNTAVNGDSNEDFVVTLGSGMTAVPNSAFLTVTTAAGVATHMNMVITGLTTPAVSVYSS